MIVDALAERDPKAAVSLLAQADGLWNNRRTVTILMHALVKDGLADAIEALDAMPPRVQMSARHDLLGALRRGTGNLDFRTVLDWYELLPQAIRDKLVHSFAGAYSAHDPGQAVRWALSLEDDEAKHDALRSAMSQLGADNRDAGHRLLDVIDDPATLGIALAGFVQGYRHEDPQGAWQWAQSNRLGEHRPDSLRSAFHQWAYTSPEKATEGLLALPADLRDQTAAGIRSSTMRRLGTRRVERIFNALGSPSARRQLAKKLAEHYTLYQEDELKAEFYRSIAFESDRDNSTGSHRP
ncbi:MAG: hypothetical protein F4Z28_06930 [Gammaproteobacteria bacterium]|nr:hypothetical protein [Gammaproteobacteria bacterium]